MSDARQVWDVWRRILASDALVAAVLRPGAAALPPDLGADERAILAAYAAEPIAAEVTVGMFRRRLPKNALSALKLVPLTRRVLHGSGLDPEQIAGELVRATGFRDHGPNLWRSAADFVDFLATLPAFARPPWQDVLALDRAAIALVRRLGAEPPPTWPDELAAAADDAAYVAHPAATVASTAHDLTPWLEDPYGFAADAELEHGERHWLIYVPDAAAPHTHAELSPRAARVFALLAAPHTTAELAPHLDGLAEADIVRVLDALLEAGAIVRAPGEVTA